MEMAKERNDKRAKFIKEMRIKLAWSQEHLAEVAGVSSRTIQRIEKEGIGEFETLMGLAQAFDIDVTELMQISQSEKIDEKLQKHFEGITFFTQMTSGKGILDLGFGTLGIIPGMPQVKNKEEASLFGNFIDFIRDSLDASSDVSATTFFEMQIELDSQIKQFESKGFFIFGAKSNATIKAGGIKLKPMQGKVCNLLIVEKGHKAIVGDDSQPRLIAVRLSDQSNIGILR